jgi:hypothetical protein
MQKYKIFTRKTQSTMNRHLNNEDQEGKTGHVKRRVTAEGGG